MTAEAFLNAFSNSCSEPFLTCKYAASRTMFQYYSRTHLKNNGVTRPLPRERGAAAQAEACPRHDEAEPFGAGAARKR